MHVSDGRSQAEPIWRRSSGSPAGCGTNIEQRHRGQARRGVGRARRAAGRGPPADRGRARRRQDDAGKALARSIDCTVRRIQFTPDLLPSDVTGVSVFNQDTREFEFRPGRCLRQHRGRRRDQPRLPQDAVGPARVHGGASGHRRQHDLPPRGAVHGHRDPEPDRDGGHLRPPRGPARPLHGPGLGGLPGRGRRDRDAQLAHAAPTRSTTSSRSPTPARSASWSRSSARCTSPTAVQRYAVALTTATRTPPSCTLGASPRATLHLVRAAKAAAAMAGRDYVLPDDVHALARPVLAHRLLPSVEAAMSGRSEHHDPGRHRRPRAAGPRSRPCVRRSPA